MIPPVMVLLLAPVAAWLVILLVVTVGLWVREYLDGEVW